MKWMLPDRYASRDGCFLCIWFQCMPWMGVFLFLLPRLAELHLFLAIGMALGNPFKYSCLPLRLWLGTLHTFCTHLKWTRTVSAWVYITILLTHSRHNTFWISSHCFLRNIWNEQQAQMTFRLSKSYFEIQCCSGVCTRRTDAVGHPGAVVRCPIKHSTWLQ